MLSKARTIRLSSVGARGLINFCLKEPRIVYITTRKLGRFYLKHFLPELITHGHGEYVRFITIGRPRTGSNLLRGSLMSHSQIIVFGDLFKRYNINRSNATVHWGIPFYPQTESMLSLAQNDPIRFLETEVFREFPKNISAVGFKVLYPAVYKESWEPILMHLGNQKDLRIVHIKRKNFLKAHLSRSRQGARKDKYVNITGAKEHYPPIPLDYEDCLQAFMNTRKWEEDHDSFFADHDKIDVFYENLACDYDNEMRRVQEFLGVEHEVVKPLTYKQSSQPLTEAITNYLELKERFRGTPWEEFFEDQG